MSRKKSNIEAPLSAYIFNKNVSMERNMQEQFEVKVDERTGETCLTGYDSKNKMRITFLFQSDMVIDTEKVITDALKTCFMERIKKTYKK